jgi:hypothetical protein
VFVIWNFYGWDVIKTGRYRVMEATGVVKALSTA